MAYSEINTETARTNREIPANGYINPPLIAIEPSLCPPDILHMKKRIISRQLDQVLEWVICQGKTEVFQQELISNNINVDMGLGQYKICS